MALTDQLPTNVKMLLYLCKVFCMLVTATVLSTGDKITTCEWLDNGSSKSEITCEYKIAVYLFHVFV